MKISSDEHAWALLGGLLESSDVPDVEFDGWPMLDIKINGDEYRASLNSRQMAALVELEHVFGRAYSVVAHGAYDKRRLRAEEEEDLQFSTTVREGSSILQTDLTPLVKAFASAVASNPQLALLSAVTLGLILVSKPLILKHYENRAKQLELEDKKLLLAAMNANPGDAAKVELIEKSVKKVATSYPQFVQVVPQARQAFWKFASASVDAESLTVEGVEFSQAELEILSSRRARRPSDVKEIKDKFRINYVRKSGASFIVGLESKKLALGATFKKPHLTENKIKRLMNLMASGEKIEALLEVRVVDKANLSGRLISFKPIGIPG